MACDGTHLNSPGDSAPACLPTLPVLPELMLVQEVAVPAVIEQEVQVVISQLLTSAHLKHSEKLTEIYWIIIFSAFTPKDIYR